ncbi:ribbon-helix-helix domain-containing protein [Methylobacterium sp. A54F]
MRTGRTRGKQTGIQIQVRVQPEQVASLDALITAQPDPKPSRPDVIREALSEHLKAKGYLK